MRKIALWLALGALGVNAPRFVILFLMVDSIYLARGLEGLFLAITGIATGAVLSGGGAFIAHVLAHPTRGGAVRGFLTLTWILLLVFNVILLAPMMVMSLRTSRLVAVLDTPELQWLWSVVAIVSVECLAGGAMAAYALLDRNPRSEPFDTFLERLSGGLFVPPRAEPPNYDHSGDPTRTRKERQH
jgi:hypothetical protein